MLWNNVEELFIKLKRNEIKSSADLLEYVSIELVERVPCVCGKLFTIGKGTDEYYILRCNYCNRSKRISKFINKLETKIPVIKLLRMIFKFTLNIDNGIIAENLELCTKTVNKIILEMQIKIL